MDGDVKVTRGLVASAVDRHLDFVPCFVSFPSQLNIKLKVMIHREGSVISFSYAVAFLLLTLVGFCA